jgi:hypothetical protein
VELFVLVENRSVTRELEIDRHRRFSLYGDSFLDDLHLLPVSLVPILERVEQVCFIDIEVFLVDGKDGKSPCPVVIVTNGDAREARLSSSYDIPSRSVEVYPVPERGDLLAAVRVIG